jgi:hypothetical protein
MGEKPTSVHNRGLALSNLWQTLRNISFWVLFDERFDRCVPPRRESIMCRVAKLLS